jgi:hypothetical protein
VTCLLITFYYTLCGFLVMGIVLAQGSADKLESKKRIFGAGSLGGGGHLYRLCQFFEFVQAAGQESAHILNRAGLCLLLGQYLTVRVYRGRSHLYPVSPRSLNSPRLPLYAPPLHEVDSVPIAAVGIAPLQSVSLAPILVLYLAPGGHH